MVSKLTFTLVKEVKYDREPSFIQVFIFSIYIFNVFNNNISTNNITEEFGSQRLIFEEHKGLTETDITLLVLYPSLTPSLWLSHHLTGPHSLVSLQHIIFV